MSLGVIYLGMRFCIVGFDVREIGCRVEGIDVPVHEAEPPVDSWIARPDIADVCLEMLDVDRVETDNRGVESNISLSNILAPVVRAL